MKIAEQINWIWAFFLSLILSVTLQIYIGNSHLYFKREAPNNAEWLAQHEGVLNNNGSGASEALLGKNGVNIRIGIVYLADWISKTINQPVMKVYRWLDNIFLTGTFFVLYCFIKSSMGSNLAFIGLLYFGFSQITSYFPGGWHPWDRLSQFLWLLSLFLVRTNRMIALLPVVWCGVLVKYDLIMISGVYFLAYVSKSNWKKTFAISLGLFSSCFGILLYLLHLFPRGTSEVGSSSTSFGQLIEVNLKLFLKSPLSYPPTLVFALPILLGVWGWKHATQFEKSGFSIAGLAMFGYFATSYFNETRAEMPLLLMMLPCALRGINNVSFNNLEE